MKTLLISMVGIVLLFSSANSSDTRDLKLDVTNRPKYMKAFIDEAHKNVSSETTEQWVARGEWPYNLLQIPDPVFLKGFLTPLIKQGQTVFNFLDYGSGDGTWGRYLAKWIDAGDIFPNKVQFNIFSLTGEKVEEPKITKTKKCTIYNLGKFKLECLDPDCLDPELNIKIKGEVDFIISRYCLLHLVDPFTDLQILINLLRKNSGLLMTHSFEFELVDRLGNPVNKASSNNIRDFVSVFVQSKVPFLIGSDNNDTIFLKRPTTDAPFQFSIDYYRPLQLEEESKYIKNDYRAKYAIANAPTPIFSTLSYLLGSKSIFDEVVKYYPDITARLNFTQME